MDTKWIASSSEIPPENTEVAVLIPIIDNKTGNYKQIHHIATYSKEGRYETTISYFRNVTYYIPYTKNIDLDAPEGYLNFVRLASATAKPEHADKPETWYVVRVEYNGRVEFTTANYVGGKWRNNTGSISNVTHAATLPEIPPMPEEYI
jgi:hypothetical protein